LILTWLPSENRHRCFFLIRLHNPFTMSTSKPQRRLLGYWSTVSIGIGGMVGGGIFAVLGLAVQLAQGGTPVAFLLAGAVALLTSYSYAHLSVAYPAQGGTVEFMNRAFGPGLITGALNVLLWLSYVVMLSLYAHAFGSYGASLFGPAHQTFLKHLFVTGIVFVFTALNVSGAQVVGRAEKIVVGLKIAILFLFVTVGLLSVDFVRLEPSTWSHPLRLIAGGMIIFLAYEGFELIANTAADIREPRKTLPRAYYSSVLFVIALYILVSAVTVGNLSIDKIAAARDYALAESARPFLGTFGFLLIAVAALLSTSSAINATLYGAARISYCIAKDGELPAFLEKKIWNRPVEGLLITSVFTLLLANLFDLSSISIMGSAGFLIIFAAVNLCNLRLHRVTASNVYLCGMGFLVCMGALIALLWQTTLSSPHEIWILAIMIFSALTIETIYRRITGRTILLSARR
jgi:amino acid transporter